MPKSDKKNKNNLNITNKKSVDPFVDNNLEGDSAQQKSKINNILNSYFKYFIFIVVAAILFGSYVYILKPKYEEVVKVVYGDIDNQEKVYLQQLKKLNSFKKIVSIYNSIPNDEKERLNNLLPPDYIKEQLFIELGYILPQNGYNLSYLNFEKDIETEKEDENRRQVNSEKKSEFYFLNDLPEDIGYIKAGLEVSMIDYNSLRNLISLLEYNLKLIDIYSIDFNPNSETLNLKFVTYYLKS